MLDYWIRDNEGRILGPVKVAVIRDLAADGRINGFHQASRDGRTFAPITSFPELAATLMPPALVQRRQRDLQQAERVRLELQRYRTLAPNELFGVRKGATEQEYRPAFRALAGPYRPANLPQGAHPELLKACTDTFEFLTAQLRQLEKSWRSEASSPQTKPKAGDTWQPLFPDSFLILERSPSIALTVRVDEANASLFTRHQTLNIESKSVFLPSPEILPLGTHLDLILRFQRPPKDIRTKAVVIWENARVGPDPVGIGVRMEGLPASEISFIRDYVLKAGAELRR